MAIDHLALHSPPPAREAQGGEGLGVGGQPRARSEFSAPIPPAFASLTRSTLPATKPGLARVSQKIVRKSGQAPLAWAGE